MSENESGEFAEPGVVDWAMLVPHSRRGGLFLLEDDVDIAVVARAIAADDTSVIAPLLESGKMRRPSDDELGGDGDRRFLFAIVQPFVLAQGPVLD